MMHTISIIITGIVGASLTFYINEHRKQGAVRASALTSLIVAIIFKLLENHIDTQYTTSIPTAFIGASFIGMVSSKALKHIRWVAIAGFIFSLIFLSMNHYFKGYGGALGTAASISVMATMSIPIVIKHKYISNGILLLRRMIYRSKNDH